MLVCCQEQLSVVLGVLSSSDTMPPGGLSEVIFLYPTPLSTQLRHSAGEATGKRGNAGTKNECVSKLGSC